MSDKLDSLFPKAHLDAMYAAARADVRAVNSSMHADAAASDGVKALLRCFPRGFDGFHTDATESYYTARQLEHIRLGVVEADFPPIEYQTLLPIDTSPHPGATTYTVNSAEFTGRSRVTAGIMPGIIPNVDVGMSSTSVPFVDIMLCYTYSLEEARKAMMAGMPLNADRAMRTREQVNRDINEIALIGGAGFGVSGVKGLFTLASTATYTTPTGTGGSKTWALKTPNEILADWNGAVSQVITDTNKAEVPDTSVLPVTVFEYVANTKVGDGTSDSIMTYFMKNQRHIKRVDSSVYLASHATAWTGKRMINYSSNPLKVALILPVPFEQLSPDVTSMMTTTNCHAKTAGVVATKPKGVIYSDEI